MKFLPRFVLQREFNDAPGWSYSLSRQVLTYSPIVRRVRTRIAWLWFAVPVTRWMDIPGFNMGQIAYAVEAADRLENGPFGESRPMPETSAPTIKFRRPNEFHRAKQ